MPENETNIKNKVVNGLSWAMAERILTYIVNFAISIVLARLILPEAYGTVALIQIFITLSTIFVTCGLGYALVQKKEPTSEEYSTMFYANTIMGIVLYFVIFFASPLIADFYDKPDLLSMIRILAIEIPVASVYNIQSSYVQKNMAFKKFFFSSLSGTIVSGIAGIILALHGFGAWALIISTLADQLMDSIILFFTTRWIPKIGLHLKKSKSMFSFAYKIVISEFISRAYDQIRSLVIGKVYSSADLAYNNKGEKFPELIIELTNSSIIRVMFPTFSVYQNDPAAMAYVAGKSISVSSFLLAPMMIGLASIANRFIPFVYSDNWIACVPFLQLYCITFLFQPIHVINLKIIQALGRSDISLKIEIIKKSAGIIFLALAVIFFKKAIYVAASFSAMSLLALFINAYPCKRLINYGLKEELKDIAPSLLISAIMGVAVYFIGLIPLSNWLALIIQVLSGAIIYFGLSALFKVKAFSFLLSYLKEKVKKTR